MSNDETAREQEYISLLYRRLDALREQAAGRLAGVLRMVGGTPQARTERDVFSATYRQRLAQLDAAGQPTRLSVPRGPTRAAMLTVGSQSKTTALSSGPISTSAPACAPACVSASSMPSFSSRSAR